jgi:potassium voltage-gated channel Shal-related subfamily D protein
MISASTSTNTSQQLNLTLKRVIINARGFKFEVLKDNLKKLPNSRLGKLENYINNYMNKIRDENSSLQPSLNEICDDYDLNLEVFYFDKDPFVLNTVLNYYSNGNFHIDQNMCPFYLNEELKYWGLDKYLANDCCFYRFQTSKSDLKDELNKQKKNN